MLRKAKAIPALFLAVRLSPKGPYINNKHAAQLKASFWPTPLKQLPLPTPSVRVSHSLMLEPSLTWIGRSSQDALFRASSQLCHKLTHRKLKRPWHRWRPPWTLKCITDHASDLRSPRRQSNDNWPTDMSNAEEIVSTSMATQNRWY